MKKFVLIMALIFCCSPVFAGNTTLDNIEKSLYGFTYNNENDSTRLNRIEKKIYGETSKDNNTNRIAKLKKDLNTDMWGQEIPPKEDTFMSEDDYIVYEKEPEEAKTMDYPVIDELEKAVFKKEFKTKDIKTRLSDLEKETFKKTYPNDDLSTRTDRLKAQIKPYSFANNGMMQQENDFYSDSFDKLAQDYHLDQYGAGPFDYDFYNPVPRNYQNNNIPAYNSNFQNSKPLNLSKIEKQLYHNKFENQPTSERLTRIETTIFGTSFPNDTNHERMQRLSSAIQAQKSSRKYDSNKFNQNLATAVQIGTLILMVLACIL